MQDPTFAYPNHYMIQLLSVEVNFLLADSSFLLQMQVLLHFDMHDMLYYITIEFLHLAFQLVHHLFQLHVLLQALVH